MDDQRPRHSSAATRLYLLLKALAGVLALVGVLFIGMYLVLQAREQSTIDSLATPVPTLSATSTTTSASPTATASKTTATASSSSKASSKTTSPKPATVVPFDPKHIWIPAISVNTEVVSKPSVVAWDAHLGKTVQQFGVPTGERAMYQVAWWSDGPRPGELRDGMIPVLLGHTQIGGYGVFNNLGALKPGQTMTLAAADPHKVQRYKVLKVITGIPKNDENALLGVLNGHPKAADLAAITCSGSVKASIKSRKDNTVVFLTLVESKGK